MAAKRALSLRRNHKGRKNLTVVPMVIKYKGGEKMEEKKQEWKLEQPQEQADEKMKEESKLDKTALADYIISKMPPELAEMLNQGKDIESLVMQWENRMLKKENEALKKRLEKETAKPLTLAGEGGEGEKDPFVSGFMQALANY